MNALKGLVKLHIRAVERCDRLEIDCQTWSKQHAATALELGRERAKNIKLEIRLKEREESAFRAHKCIEERDRRHKIELEAMRLDFQQEIQKVVKIIESKMIGSDISPKAFVCQLAELDRLRALSRATPPNTESNDSD